MNKQLLIISILVLALIMSATILFNQGFFKELQSTISMPQATLLPQTLVSPTPTETPVATTQPQNTQTQVPPVQSAPVLPQAKPSINFGGGGGFGDD